MTAGQYAIGVLVLAALLASLATTAITVRREVLPGSDAAIARVGEVVIALAVVLLAAELLGALGIFTRAWLLAVCGACAGTSLLVARRRAGGERAASPGAAPEAAPGPAIVGREHAALFVALIIVGLMLVPWFRDVLNAIHGGMREYDTVTYHMPFAAHFAQDASTTGIVYDGNPPVSFYPANSELLHAIGIVALGRDLLSPLLNLGWLSLALVSAWGIGRRFGAAPAAVAATAVVCSLPVMVYSEAGTAKNDLAALALLLAAVALWVSRSRSAGAIALAALAGGLAVGTRLNLLAPVLALLAVVVLTSARGGRWRAGGWMVGGVLVGGGFWYARNLAATGNPLPWFGGRLAGLITLPTTTPPTDCGTTSIAHYLGHPSFASAHLVPQLAPALGWGWWLLMVAALAGIVAGLGGAAGAVGRGLAVVALLTAIAYVLTPAGAGGAGAHCFSFNTRFAAPALALALIVLALALARRRIPPPVVLIGYLVLLVACLRWSIAVVPVILALAAVGAAAVLVLATGTGAISRLPHRVSITVLAVILVLAVAAGWREQRAYLHVRYRSTHLYEPIEPMAAALAGVHRARIAVIGLDEVYPLFGADLSNQVELPAVRIGARFYPPTNCAAWLSALSAGRFRFAVTARQSRRPAAAAAWTRRLRGAVSVAASPPGATSHGYQWSWQIFRVPPSARSDARTLCARAPPPGPGRPLTGG